MGMVVLLVMWSKQFKHEPDVYQISHIASIGREATNYVVFIATE